jgi:hypothetical protein
MTRRARRAILTMMRTIALLAVVAGCAHFSAPAAEPADKIFVGYVPHGMPGSVVGRLSDTAGSPLIGATVVAEAQDARATEAGITDDHGAFRIYGMSPGRRHVTVYYADDKRDFGWVDVGANAVTIEGALAVDRDAGPMVDSCNEWHHCGDPLINTSSTMTGLKVGAGSL